MELLRFTAVISLHGVERTVVFVADSWSRAVDVLNGQYGDNAGWVLSAGRERGERRGMIDDTPRRRTWLVAAEHRELLADRKHAYQEAARFTLCGLPVAALTMVPGLVFAIDDETGFLCRDCVAEARA